MEVYKSRKEKIITEIVFVVYILLLIWLVLFKFATSISDIPSMRGVNLIPFSYDQENSVHLKEVLYNLIVFVPAGFYFTAFLGKKRVFSGVLATALLSLSFEVIQWVFAIGASDITDLITNTLGGLCGMLLFVVMGKLCKNHRMTIINTLGMVIEALGVALLALLILAN